MAQTPEKSNKPYHHGNLKNALIQAGREVLESEGSPGFDLRMVARKAGVSHAAPYRHFSDKRALITAIVQAGFEELRERMVNKLADTDRMPPSERLRVVAIEYVRFATQSPWVLREMYSGQSAQDENIAVHSAAKKVYRIYSSLIRAGQESGEFSEGDPNAIAGVFWSLIHGMATLVIDDQITPYAQGDQGIEQIVGFGIRTLISGMSA